MNSNTSDNDHSGHANPYNQPFLPPLCYHIPLRKKKQQLAYRRKVTPAAVTHKQRLQPDHYSGTVNREVLALTEYLFYTQHMQAEQSLQDTSHYHLYS